MSSFLVVLIIILTVVIKFYWLDRAKKMEVDEKLV